MKNEIAAAFDYSLVTAAEADKLRECEAAIKQETAGYFTKLGEKFKEARDLLSHRNDGTFEKWYTSLGFKRQTVYNLIQRYEFLISPTVGEISQDLLEDLPLTLTYEISRPNAPKELVNRVLDGDITTNAEYQKLKKAYDTTAKKLDEANRENIRVAKQRGELYDKCAALEKQVQELENRPVEVAVERPDNWISPQAYEERVDELQDQINALENELIEKGRAAHAKEQEYKAHIAELENGGTDDERFNALCLALGNPLTMMQRFTDTHLDYAQKAYDYIKETMDNIKDNIRRANT